VQSLVQILEVTFAERNNAPAHMAHETEQLLTHETSDLIAESLWLANSLDLSPVGYRIWGNLQEHVYGSRIHDVSQLKSHLIEE